MTAFGGYILSIFFLHEDEKILLYFFECSRKVSVDEIILNTLLIDDFCETWRYRKTGLSNNQHDITTVSYYYERSLKILRTIK